MKLLKGKVAIISGGTRGIGKGIALKFAQEGADVIFTYVSSEETANAVEKEIQAFGVKGKGYKSNAAKMEDAVELIDKVVEEFGQIDILVNNAGITKDGLLMRMSEENFDDVIKINLNSVFNMTKAALRTFLKQKNGSIINMSSIVGVRWNAGQANYSASKAGIIGFTKSIAAELGSRNIRCNAIAPGFIATEMTEKLDPEVVKGWSDSIPLKRPGTPEDIANATVFLASDMSTYISGQVLSVCGGMLM